MDNYIIHACPQRMWYVDEFLVPSLKEQGIEDDRIKIRCDKQRVGNLVKCMEIFERMPDNDGGAWHLQDDVVICRNFKERTESHSVGIVAGFVGAGMDENIDYIGVTTIHHLWWSFPCIRIPNKIARKCGKWFFEEAYDDNKYLLLRHPHERIS